MWLLLFSRDCYFLAQVNKMIFSRLSWGLMTFEIYRFYDLYQIICEILIYIWSWLFIFGCSN